MPEDKEYAAFRAHLDDLKLVASEVSKILKEGSVEDISRAAKHYPVKLNHLLLKRNIKSARAIFPFVDLALIQERKPNIRLLNLNYKKDDRELLWDVIRRVEVEIAEFD